MRWMVLVCIAIAGCMGAPDSEPTAAEPATPSNAPSQAPDDPVIAPPLNPAEGRHGEFWFDELQPGYVQTTDGALWTFTRSADEHSIGLLERYQAGDVADLFVATDDGPVRLPDAIIVSYQIEFDGDDVVETFEFASAV